MAEIRLDGVSKNFGKTAAVAELTPSATASSSSCSARRGRARRRRCVSSLGSRRPTVGNYRSADAM